VNATCVDCALGVPARFVSIAYTSCEPTDRSFDGLIVHLPSVPAFTEPITVAPSYSVTISPAFAVPLIVGCALTVEPPAGIDVPASSVRPVITGLTGTLVSTVKVNDADGALDVPAELIDVAVNVCTASVNGLFRRIDQLPSASTTVSPQPLAPSSRMIVSPGLPVPLSGTAKAGDIVTLYDGATVIGSVKAGTDGKWTIKPSKDLSVGSHDVYAIDTNLAGTPSAQSTHVAFTVISAVAAAPVIANVVDATSAHTGTVPAGGVTADAQPTISGTGIPGNTVYLYQNGVGCGDTKVLANGTWSIKLSGPMSAGVHDMTATQFAAGQAQSVVSNHWSFTIDTSVPVKPVITGLTDDAGASIPAGGSTVNAHPTVSGTAKAGDIVTLYDGATVIGSVKAGTDGKWTIKPSKDLSVGSHDVYAIDTNLAGTPSAQSTHVAFTVISAFAAPVIANVVDATSAHTGTIPAGGVTADAQPTVSGTGIPGNTVWLYQNGVGCGDTKVLANGTWSIKLVGPMSQGVHDMTATQFAAGQAQSAVSNHWSITIDSSVPAKPVITGLTDDAGASIPAGSTTPDVHPNINGTGKAGDIVTVYDGAKVLGSVKVDGNGKWTLKTPDLSTGSHDVYAIDTNLAGTPSAQSNHVAFTVGTIAPTVPVITGVIDAVGPVTGNIPSGGTMDDSRPTIKGTGKPGDTINIFDGPTRGIGDTVVASDGTWSIRLIDALPLGAHTIYAKEISGTTTTAAASTYSFTLVAPGPVTPTETVTITNLIDDSGSTNVSVAKGGSTKDTSPIVQGTVSAALLSGETLAVYRDNVKVGTATMNGKNWTFNDSKVAVGSHTYTAQVENSVGAGQRSAGYSFTENASTIAVGMTLDFKSGNIIVTLDNYASVSRVGIWISEGNYGVPASESAISDGKGTYKVWIQVHSYSDLSAANLSLLYKVQLTFNDGTMINLYSGSWGAFVSTYGDIVRTITVTPPGVKAVRDMSLESGDSAALATNDQAQDTHAVATTHDNSVTPQHTVVGANDVFKGTTGNDTVDLNVDPVSYFKGTTAHIEGNTVHPVEVAGAAPAVNTLHLTGDHQVLDLTSLTGKTAAAKISGIEVIDLGGQHNTLKLSLIDVLNLGETDLFQKDGKQQMMVNGKEGDEVDLSNSHVAGLADGEWQQHGTAQVGGVTYNVYEHSGAHTELLVQQGVQIVVQ
jgi:nucleoid-associated protein YgaU